MSPSVSPWVVVIAAFVGALIGSLGTIITSVLLRRTEMTKLAVQSAIEEKKLYVELIKLKAGQAAEQGKPFGYTLYPMGAMIHFQAQIIEELRKHGRITPERYKVLKDEFKALSKSFLPEEPG